MYLFNILELSRAADEAAEMPYRIWTPDDTWQALMDETLEKYVGQYL